MLLVSLALLPNGPTATITSRGVPLDLAGNHELAASACAAVGRAPQNATDDELVEAVRRAVMRRARRRLGLRPEIVVGLIR